VLLATTFAFFIFSGMYYSYGAYQISTVTFNLMGVVPHAWAQYTPWLTIFMACQFYLMVTLAARFTKYHLYKDLQDEVRFLRKFEKHKYFFYKNLDSLKKFRFYQIFILIKMSTKSSSLTKFWVWNKFRFCPKFFLKFEFD